MRLLCTSKFLVIWCSGTRMWKTTRKMIPTTEAIVLKSFDYRETSKIVRFFSRDHGKFSGILKGIRKDYKKFGSNVDKFTVNQIVYYRYSRSDLHLVTQCDLKEYYFPIRQDYKRSLAANYMLELVDKIMAVDQTNKKVYRLMLDYLRSLETVKDIDKLVYMFQIKVLIHSGFRPHIDACVRCGKKIDGKARFSMRSGGLICPQCPTSEQSFTLISKGTVSSMLHIEMKSWAQCMKLGLTNSARKELKYILNNFLVYHLEKKIETGKFLAMSP